MKKKDNATAKTKIKKSKRKNESQNKKRLNNKVLKAKEIISKNREALKYGGKVPDVPRVPAWKRFFHILRRCLLWAAGIVLVVSLISFLIIRINGGTPTVFGYSIQRISSGSMEPELKVGDMIISHTVSSPDEIKIGDIITYEGDAKHDYRSITHRVVEAPEMNQNGEYVLTTKGDANTVKDGQILYSDVQFKYVNKFDVINKIYNFFLSPGGLLTFFGIVIFACFDELLTIAKVLTGHYHDEEEEKKIEEEERIKAFEEDELRRKEELREKKWLNPRKYDSTSNRKKKNRKKRSKPTEAENPADRAASAAASAKSAKTPQHMPKRMKESKKKR